MAPLYHLLRNRIYRGEVVHKGIVHPGEHQAIVDEGLWKAVQERLTANIQIGRRRRIETGALLMGLIRRARQPDVADLYGTPGQRYRYCTCQGFFFGQTLGRVRLLYMRLPQRTSVVAISGVAAAKRLLASSSKLNPLST